MTEPQNLGEFDAHVAKRYQVSSKWVNQHLFFTLKHDPIYPISFKMEKRLGRGAYGIVWKAKTRKSNRVVTIYLIIYVL